MLCVLWFMTGCLCISEAKLTICANKWGCAVIWPFVTACAMDILLS